MGAIDGVSRWACSLRRRCWLRAVGDSSVDHGCHCARGNRHGPFCCGSHSTLRNNRHRACCCPRVVPKRRVCAVGSRDRGNPHSRYATHRDLPTSHAPRTCHGDCGAPRRRRRGSTAPVGFRPGDIGLRNPREHSRRTARSDRDCVRTRCPHHRRASHHRAAVRLDFVGVRQRNRCDGAHHRRPSRREYPVATRRRRYRAVNSNHGCYRHRHHSPQRCLPVRSRIDHRHIGLDNGGRFLHQMGERST